MIEEGKTFRDYITEYQAKAKSDQIHRVATMFGMDESKLREMMNLKLTEANINEYGRFDTVKETVNKEKARVYFEEQQGVRILPFKVNVLVDNLLRRFLLEDGFDVELPDPTLKDIVEKVYPASAVERLNSAELQMVAEDICDTADKGDLDLE